jgi:glucose/arabinose dehydrogenase
LLKIKSVAAASLAAISSFAIQRLLSKGTGIVFASGLRNTISFEWKRQTGELWA